MGLVFFLRLVDIILAQPYDKIVPVISLNCSAVVKDKIFGNGNRKNYCL